MNKFNLLVKTSRPIGWVLGPIVFFIGLVYVQGSISILAIIQAILLSFPGSIFLYGINDVYDYESDKRNPRKKLLEGIKLEKKHHSFIKKTSYIMMLILLLSSILTLNISNIIAMVILIAVSYYYSAPPIRLKEKPIFDSISNGIIVLATFALGYSFEKPITLIPLDIYLIALAVGGAHAYAAIMDYTAR